MVAGEPEWLPEDLDVALEWQRHLDEQCTCGNPLMESTDPELEGAYEAQAVVCHACAAREAASKKFADADGVKLATHLTAEARAYLDGRDDV